MADPVRVAGNVARALSALGKVGTSLHRRARTSVLVIAGRQRRENAKSRKRPHPRNRVVNVATPGRTPLMARPQPEPPALGWSYGGRTGPEYWADLRPEFSLCRCGRQQSPIDIVTTRSEAAKAISLNYAPISPIRITNTGRTVEVSGVPSCDITLDDMGYELTNIHFHTPSEHRIDGRLAEMEMHLAHQSSEGNLAVIAVLIDEGTFNVELSPVFDNLSAPGLFDQFIAGSIDPAGFLPENRACFQYSGSRTIPPCHEGVTWFVLREHMQLSKEQIGAFRQIFDLNARPIQAVTGREVHAYRIEEAMMPGLQAEDV